jgi:hypothetical protein
MKHVSAVSVAQVNTFRTRLARVALSGALAFSGIASADQCQNIGGAFGPLLPLTKCPDGFPGLVCFHSDFNGATAISGVTSAVLIPGQTDKYFITAHSSIPLPGGSVNTFDVGVGTDCAGPMGPCGSANEVLTITSGSGVYTQSYGTIFLSGQYLMGLPGAYQGRICTGKKGRG